MTRWWSFGVVLTTVAATVACASSQEVPIEDLPPPVLYWEHGNALCSRVRAADADGRLWNDQGCEDGRFGFERIGELSTEERATLTSVFQRFPRSTSPPECTNGMAHHFVRRGADGSETSWRACGTSQVEGSTEGLAPPFLDAARLLGR